MTDPFNELIAHEVLGKSLASLEPPPKPITVIIPTYNRPEILVHTVQKVQRNLVYDGPTSILIGDDGDDLKIKDSIGFHLVGDRSMPVQFLDGPKRGLGANLNMLLEKVETDIVLQMDDDHLLSKPLDITQYVIDMRNPEFNMGWIRLFLGEPADVYNLKTYYKFKAASYGPYWYVDTESPTLYLASNRPHLKRVDMHRKHFGWYLENVKLGKTEEGFCHQYKTTKKNQRWNETPWVTIPMFNLEIGHWLHVGESWQKRGK